MIRLLLVDDHILFLEALSGLFQKHLGFEVAGQAHSVQGAIAACRQHKPDVVLMDFLLPDGTGLDAAAAILAELPNTKIVFLTAHEDDDRLFAAIRYGAQGYLLKTTPSTELVAYLQRLDRGEKAFPPSLISRVVEEFARLSPRQDVSPAVLAKLTDRECEVLRLLQAGATNRQIAARLVISEQTVKNHVSSILDKLEVDSRRDVIHLFDREAK